jgi:RNA polymerase sigma-70 factor (ECF subfamily)
VSRDLAAHRVAEHAARESYGKLLAFLAARSGDFDAAEDALADAFAVALERWPRDGVPKVPEAWLLVTARHRLFDRMRRERRAERVAERLGVAALAAQQAFDRTTDLEDERLAMMFACAHPAIPQEARGPLILQTLLGLDAARIASAFLVAPATMSQRLVRAKRKIAAAGIPLRVPRPEEMAPRLDAVLAAIYVTFAAGWDDPVGVDPRTRGLALEALWLGRLVVAACPDEPEPRGLLALMLHAHARAGARREADGAYVPLDEQDPGRWDATAIDEAESLLASAARLRRIGRFQLEGAIQSAHSVRRFRAEPNWNAIVALYDELLRATGSPVVALNRAVAIGRLAGARAGIAALDELASEPRLEHYQPYWAARAALLAHAGDDALAREAYQRAIGLTIDPSIRRYLAARAEALKRAAAAVRPLPDSPIRAAAPLDNPHSPV